MPPGCSITEVDQSPEGAVTFPEIDPADWTEDGARRARRLRLGHLRAAPLTGIAGCPEETRSGL